jgi:cytochrome P450
MGNTAGEWFSYDPFDFDVMRNPLPYYARLREDFPIYHLPQYDGWAVSRFDDVYAVLADPDGKFSTPEGAMAGRRELAHFNHGQIREISTDPLESMNFLPRRYYAELRQSMSKSFRRHAISRLASFVREQTRQILGQLSGRDDFDLTIEFGGAVASRTVCHILDVPLEMAPRILELVNRSSRQDLQYGGFVAESVELLAELRDIAREQVVRRRAAGATGESPIIDSLLHHTVDGRPLSDDEIVVQLRSVMVGGSETVPKVAAHGLMELYKDQQQLAQVLKDLPAHVTLASQEIVRYCAPGQWFLRTVVEPVTIAGQPLEVGQRVFPLVMSANRDPREFDNPDAFTWNRSIKTHLGFGQGLKFCLGSHLAQLELRIMLEEFLTAFPDYAIDEKASERPPSNFQWGWSHVRAIPHHRSGVGASH